MTKESVRDLGDPAYTPKASLPHNKTCPYCKDIIDNPAHKSGRWITRDEARRIIKELKRQISD